MVVHDPAWDMPEPNWIPQSSFETPIRTPLLPPNGGTLVCIPPFNDAWLPIIEGCLDQLRNPATWAAVDDADMNQVLHWVDQLKQLFFQAGACVDLAMQLTAECGLQFSVDGGTTWIDVSNWTTNFCSCVSGCIVFPVPPTPPDGLINQHACNIAGFLASKIIQEAMVKVVAYVGSSTQEVQFATDILATIGFAFPITYQASIAFKDWYNSVVSQVLSEVEFASTDPVLWSDVTCAIYSAIRSVGYVDETNFSAVHTNLAAISYTYGWVAPVVAQWWIDMGLVNIRAAQNVGAFDDVDCTACPTTWCYEWDFRSGPGPFARYPGTSYGLYVAGVGWEMEHVSGAAGAIEIYTDVPGVPHITEVKAHIFANSSAHIAECGLVILPGPTEQVFNSVTYGGPYGDGSTDVSFSTFTNGGTRIDLFLETTAWASPASNWVVQKLSITGTGVNPYGADNCTF